MKKSLFIFLILLNFLFVIQVKAFSISPAKIIITTEKNNTELVQIKIMNNEDQNNNFLVNVYNTSQNQDGTLDIIKDDSLKNWLYSKEKNIFIRANQEKIIDFYIDVADYLYPGSHFFALSVTKLGEENIKTQLVSVLDLEIAGIVNENLSLNKLINNKIFFNKDLKFYTEFKNNSNVALNLEGQIKIKNILGRQKYLKNINLGNKLLTNVSRNLDINILEKENKIFWPGIYKAELNIKYGRTGQNISLENIFVYLPVWFIILLFILLSAIFTKIYYRKKYAK